MTKTEMTEEELRARIARDEARAAKFGTRGRVVSGIALVVLCIALGMSSLAFKIIAGISAGAILLGYIAAATVITKRLDALRGELPVEIYTPTDFFTALSQEFDETNLTRFTDRVKAKSVRAFRDDRVLETQFSMNTDLVLSCEFDNTEARLIVNFLRERPYRLSYSACESTQELFDALVREIEALEVI